MHLHAYRFVLACRAIPSRLLFGLAAPHCSCSEQQFAVTKTAIGRLTTAILLSLLASWAATATAADALVPALLPPPTAPNPYQPQIRNPYQAQLPSASPVQIPTATGAMRMQPLPSSGNTNIPNPYLGTTAVPVAGTAPIPPNNYPPSSMLSTAHDPQFAVPPPQPGYGGPSPGAQLPAPAGPAAPGTFLASFGAQQPGPNDPPAPAGVTPSYGDLLRRLEAAEAELNAMQQQMQPNEKRLKELEEADRKLASAQTALPIVRLSGFFQYDTGWFSQDINSKDVLGNIQNGSSFRRTRLQGLGQLTEFTTFSIEMDFAFPGRPSFMDVWGEQSNLPLLGHARIGQFRVPNTMDSWTNVKHLEFLERSAPFIAMDPFRRVGIMGWDNSEDERTMWAYSLFGTGWTFWNGTANQYSTEGNDNRFGTQLGDSGGIAFSARATHLLYYDPNANNRYLMHIGGGYLFGELGGEGTTGPNAKAYEARSIPEFFVGDQAGGFATAAGTPNVVDTGRFLASHYQMLHAEVAGSWGAAHYQAEYMATFVQQLGGGTVFLDGGYVQGGYFLTGENTGYNKLMGAMDYNVKPNTEFFGIGRKKPICGWGAWELAGRWSWLDLSSMQVKASNYVAGQSTFPAAVPPPQINPGVLNEPTIALNWWWNQYMRMQFNYIHSMVQTNSTGFYSTDIFALRFQTEF